MQCPPRWEFSLEMEMLGLMGDEKERNQGPNFKALSKHKKMYRKFKIFWNNNLTIRQFLYYALKYFPLNNDI